MGACNEGISPDIFPQLYKQHRPEAIQKHLLALIQLEYFQTKKKKLLRDAELQTNQLASKILEQVKEIQCRCEVLYQQKLDFVNSKRQNHPKLQFTQSKGEIQAELTQLRQKFRELKDILHQFLRDFAAELGSYLEAELLRIRQQIQQRTVKITYSDQLKKQHVESYFQRLRKHLRTQIKKSYHHLQYQVGYCLNADDFIKVSQKVFLDDLEINMKLDAICKIVAAANNQPMFKLKQGFLKLIITDSDDEADHQTHQLKDHFWATLRQKQNAICSMVDEIKQGTELLKDTISSINTQFVKSEVNSSFNSFASSQGSKNKAISSRTLPLSKARSLKKNQSMKTKKSVSKYSQASITSGKAIK